ncbi:MAG: Crp/Fnr family transcriptional regulator [Burkholderiaceae bacterium]|jgi:CRP/FNR family cyclic AMP-dependent transcriptional regulator|nr:Crp/Fnr family transcriptional regulator [Burkholderiaceae bacterium]MCZ8174921.1 Crp/Fnr family transcriptional regulator [Burkholderiaceae bacterium]
MTQTPPTPRDSGSEAAWSPSLRRLAARGVIKSFRSGTQFITEGEPGDTLYIVVEGRLRAFSEDADGREVRYAEYGPGDYVGEMSLDGGLRAANVATLTPCRLAMVTRATLQAHLADEPEFAFELLAKVIRRARAATVGLREIALNDVYGRLKRRLDGLAQPAPGGGRVIAPPPSHATLAASLGCTRSMVSRVLKDLERGGWLVVERRGGWRLPRELPAKW